MWRRNITQVDGGGAGRNAGRAGGRVALKQTPTLVDMKSGRNKVCWSDGKGRERERERMRSWLEIIICRRPSWPRGSKERASERDAKLPPPPPPLFQPHHDGRPEHAGIPILPCERAVIQSPSKRERWIAAKGSKHHEKVVGR